MIPKALRVNTKRILRKEPRPLFAITLAPKAIPKWVNTFLSGNKVHREVDVIFVKRMMIERETTQPFNRKEKWVVPLGIGRGVKGALYPTAILAAIERQYPSIDHQCITEPTLARLKIKLFVQT